MMIVISALDSVWRFPLLFCEKVIERYQPAY
jgi:hypothetical protein